MELELVFIVEMILNWKRIYFCLFNLGELYIGIETVDGIPLEDSFLIEAQKPGKYRELISIEATPDPQCDPTQGLFFFLSWIYFNSLIYKNIHIS